MAEKVEEQVVAQIEGDGKKAAPKSNEQIGEENRIGLYNEILKLKEPGFSDEYKKIGYKKFNSLLQNDRQFQSDLLADLNDRGFNINPENFTAAYTKQAPVAVYDFSKTQEATPAPEVTKEDEGFFGTVKNMAKWAYNYGKDFYKTVKRDIYTGQAQSGAQVEDFLAGKVDTDNLAHYLKKAHEVGNIQIEAEYAKDEGALKDAGDFIAMLGPAIVGSFSSMAAAGWKKMAGITAAGAGAGAMMGGLPGAAIGGGRGAQAAMVQQGYNLEFVGSVIDELTEKGAINPDADEKTLKKQLDAAFANKELMKPIYEKANTRAGIIMGVDVLASGIGGKVVGTLRRAAMSKPVARTTIGRVLQQSAQAAAQSAPARVAVKMAERAADVGAKFAKTKAGKAVDAIDAMDIASGAGGEALAQLKTEGEINWKEVALEGGAEGSYIKALRALGDIGNRKQELLGLPQARTPEALPNAPKPEFDEVTEDEFNNYKKGNITPERAADITTDVDIAIEDPAHLEKLKTQNPLYAEMVTDAFNKHIVAVENQKLYNVALDDVAELHGKTAEDVKAAITPNTPTFNQKIADDFRNSFSVLQKQYREKAQNDSENAAGVSGEGGIGTKPEQAQSQQGAGQEAAGDGGIFQEAEGEARLAEIDELLADDDAFFAENNDRLLSPEERADLVKERESIAGPQAAAPTGLSTGATPAAAPAEVVTGATPAKGGAVASATPVQQAAPSAAPVTSVPTAGVKKEVKVDENERNEYGQLINLPKIEKSGQVETASLNIEKGVFTSNKSYVPSSYDVIKLEISKDGKTALFTVDMSMKRGIGDLQTNLGGLNPFVSYRKVGGDVFGIENVEPGVAEKQQDGSWKVIRKGAVNITGRKNVTEKNREGEAESPWTPELLAKRYKPQAVAAPTEETKETEAVSKAAATTAAPTTEVTTTPATEAAAKPAEKEIKAADVEVRKGKAHATDGVYEAVYKNKVIGKLRFNKEKKVWEDLSGDEFAAKKDAVSKFVLQYNMKQEGKTVASIKPTKTKLETKPGEEDIEVVEAEVVEDETPAPETEELPSGEGKEKLTVLPTLVKTDFERNGDLTDAGFEKATRILKGIIDRVALKAGLPPKRIYEAFHMTSDGKKYISATKGIREVQVTDFRDVIKAVKRIAFDAFPDKEFELNEQINKHVEEIYDAHLEDRDYKRNPAIDKILRVINDVNDIWAGDVSKAESLLVKGTAKSETKTETKAEGKPEVKAESENKGAAKMPTSIQDAYAKRATLRITADALVKQMGGKKLSGKAQKELDRVNAEIQKLDNLINAFEKERAKQRAESEKTKAAEKKPETKIEEKQPTKISGGTEKEIAYGNHLINELVSKDPQGEKSRQIYINGWNDIAKNKNANKANNFLEDILVGMLPADKQPTGYADIREAFKNAQEKSEAKSEKGETKTETKAETPTTKAAPTFAEFDAISADRGKMKEAKAAFIEKHGQLAYDAMKEISANFTKITKALQAKEILTKKC
jgi:hypothetical protein